MSAQRRGALSLLVAMLFLSCRRDSLTIYAPPQLAEAAIFIDGELVGQFGSAQRNYRWVGLKKIKEEIGAPPRSESVGKLSTVAHGEHQLRIQKDGYEAINTRFHYSGGSLEIEIDDAQLKPVSDVKP